MANDTILYQYESLDEGVKAIKKAAETVNDETTNLKSDTQRLFGTDFVGASADEYNTKSGEIQGYLQQKIAYIGDLQAQVEKAINDMKMQDGHGAKRIGG